MKYLIGLLLSLSLTVSAATLPSVEEHSRECFVYAWLSNMDADTINKIAKSAGDLETATAAYSMGLAEGKVIGSAVHTAASSYEEAVVLAANAWYVNRGCYVPLES